MATRHCNTITDRASRAVRSRAAAVCAVVAIASGTALAGTSEETAAKILLRALSFDRALASRAGEDVVIAIVFDGRTSDADAERDANVRAFRMLSDRTIAGLPIKVLSSDCSKSRALAEDLRSADAVYLTPGAQRCVDLVKTTTRRRDIASLAAERSFVEDGIAIGVTTESGRPRLLVNLKASRAEGLKLASQLLHLAEVIE
jgi:hypothetical protein